MQNIKHETKCGVSVLLVIGLWLWVCPRKWTKCQCKIGQRIGLKASWGDMVSARSTHLADRSKQEIYPKNKILQPQNKTNSRPSHYSLPGEPTADSHIAISFPAIMATGKPIVDRHIASQLLWKRANQQLFCRSVGRLADRLTDRQNGRKLKRRPEKSSSHTNT